jgi:hypothetical protein
VGVWPRREGRTGPNLSHDSITLQNVNIPVETFHLLLRQWKPASPRELWWWCAFMKSTRLRWIGIMMGGGGSAKFLRTTSRSRKVTLNTLCTRYFFYFSKCFSIPLHLPSYPDTYVFSYILHTHVRLYMCSLIYYTHIPTLLYPDPTVARGRPCPSC